MDQDSIRDYYDSYWDPTQGWTPDTRIDRELATCLNRYLRPGTVLDVGCGDGSNYGHFLLHQERLTEVHGIDVAPNAVARAEGRGIIARVHNLAEPLPYEAETFDNIVCFEVLEHLFDPEAVVREISRVLRPEGRLIASVPNIAYYRLRLELACGIWNAGGSPETGRKAPWRDAHLRFFTPGTFRKMCEEGGLQSERVLGHGFCLYEIVPMGSRMLRRRPFRWLNDRLLFLGNAWPSLLGAHAIIIARKRGGRVPHE